MMNRCLYAVKVVLVGLLTAQVLSTMQVYLSNAELYAKLTAIRDAGYLAIPNQHVMDSLREVGPAFFGGIFFTLTVGAGLSLICLAAAWIWQRLLSRRRLLLVPFLLLWLGCLVYINRGGLRPLVNTHFLIIPAIVFSAACRWIPEGSKHKAPSREMMHTIPIILLALVWAPQLGDNMFVEIRDNLLLSNPVGRRINDFYYEYTFYPAEVFKPLNDKTLKACNLQALQQTPTMQSVENALRNHDYLNTGPHEAVDLEVVHEGGHLLFQDRGTTILRITPQDFLSDPGKALRRLSSKMDSYVFFRQFTFLSILLAFPVLLYVILHALICAASSLFAGPRSSSIIATALCFFVGLLLLIPVYRGKAATPDVRKLSKALESERWQDRVGALRLIRDKSMDVTTLSTYQGMRTSPHVAERCWLAKALGQSRKQEAYEDLITFLDDPSPNVVSMAFYALGKKGDRRAIREIMARISVSESWYNQWYAYRALRTLGWKQTRSEQKR
jgi:hypothetical protein